MTKVDINLLKQLRQSTNAPLKDCKEALIESEGDFDKAVEILKKKWALKAAKKADRQTNEGIVKVIKEDDVIVGIKLACETDFVAKNDTFMELADKILSLIKDYVKSNNIEKIEGVDNLPEELKKQIIEELIPEYIGKIWENIRLLDVFVRRGNAYVYAHPGNKVVAVVFYKCNWQDCEQEAKEVALQVAAMSPEYLTKELIPSDILEKIKEEFKAELANSGKPDDIIDRIVQWKLSKWFNEVVLMEQPYIRDDSKLIKDILKNIEVEDFIRFSI